MREIIFRGKSVNDGKWYEGSYISMLKREYIADVQFHDIEEIKIEKAMNEVDPESLGQFTGMVDQHGTKVFEGDICEVTLPNGDTEVMLVLWNERMNKYQLKYRNGNHCSFYKWAGYKVIGNIHDDPDLIDDQASAEKKETTDAGSN